MNELTETQKAYLAGLVDGEGCITIGKNRDRYFVLQVIIVGTVLEHIKACYEMVGVGSYTIQPKKAKDSADVAFWQISGNQALTFLEVIQPYLICKLDQAKLAIEFQRHMQNSPAYNNRHPVPAGVVAYRNKMRDLLKDMKGNGKYFDDIQEQLPARPDKRWQQVSLLHNP